ncbi:HNH endonuclease signature motif containing protein [Pseudarthrobacter sulfonivorans]|uniref:HNH endonuclease signature motif containing protein n=1 Tax=Pseudarthrobacter sulfonivorans TaxID=121292 RepID=UPI0021050740|nr:HNH endonuclease signature motif containing protein [Pseudarthrobacter sulfonivorans]
MGKEAVARAFLDIESALAVLDAEVGAAAGAGSDGSLEADPLRAVGDLCLDVLAGSRRVEANVAGLKARAAVTYADTVQAVEAPDAPVQAQEMAVRAEVACALTIGDRAAGALLSQAHMLTTVLPLTFSALQAGTISWQHARVMADEAATLDPAGAAAMEAHFLDPGALDPARGCPAGEMPASRFRHKARTWRERHHTESIEQRHAKGVLDRRVEYAPDQDGMAWLSAYLPADQAAAIWNRTTAIARGLQGPDEDRTLTQLRADVVATALLSSGNTGHGGEGLGTDDSPDGTAGVDPTGYGAGRVPSPRAQVLVTVPVFSLLGATDEPAMLDGYGPIPTSMARDLVANGADSFYRVLVDPRDGAPLEIGRTSYRLTKAMRQWLRLRDGKCPFPGCSNNSLDNEADHLLAWAKGGTTGVSNLGQPCPKHHRLRHSSAWEPTPATQDEPPGWMSPSGRPYKSEHQDWEPPHWPADLQPRGHPDFLHLGLSLGEDGLDSFLHALA